MHVNCGLLFSHRWPLNPAAHVQFPHSWHDPPFRQVLLAIAHNGEEDVTCSELVLTDCVLATVVLLVAANVLVVVCRLPVSFVEILISLASFKVTVTTAVLSLRFVTAVVLSLLIETSVIDVMLLPRVVTVTVLSVLIAAPVTVTVLSVLIAAPVGDVVFMKGIKSLVASRDAKAG